MPEIHPSVHANRDMYKSVGVRVYTVTTGATCELCQKGIPEIFTITWLGKKVLAVCVDCVGKALSSVLVRL